MAKLLTVSRKSHHPIETLIKETELAYEKQLLIKE